MFRAIVLVLLMGSVAHGADRLLFNIESEMSVPQSSSYDAKFSTGGAGYLSAVVPQDAGHVFSFSANSSLESQQLTAELLGGASPVIFFLNGTSMQVPVGVNLSGYSISSYALVTDEVLALGSAPSIFTFSVRALGVPEPSVLSLLLAFGLVRLRFRR
jgi:hypothetical protein